jgi:hypothetical protein
MKMNTRNIILALLLTASTFVSQAQTNNEFTIPLSDPAKRGRLKAHLNSGDITVKGTARKDVLVRYKSANDEDRSHDHDRGRDKTNKEGLKRVGGGGMEIEASENANLVKVSSGSWNVRTNLEIEVPAGMDMQVSTYNDGDLMISDIQGELELKNYNGAITALNISGSIVAITYNGDVKMTFDKVTDGKPMSFATYNGDVDLSFPAATKGTFKMKTERGDIYTGFDMNITSSGPVRKQDEKSGSFKMVIDEWKKGDINGGGPEFTLKTNNGDIYVRKK